jgi:hypothetical protein
MKMRHYVLLAALALAACNEPSPQPEPEPNGGAVLPAPAPAPAPVPAPAPAPAPQQESAAIPTAFHGTYDRSVEACSQPSEYRLVVDASQLRFHESIAKVRSVAGEGPRRVTVEADWQGEGESWTSRRRLALSEDLATLVISGDGTALSRARCP